LCVSLTKPEQQIGTLLGDASCYVSGITRWADRGRYLVGGIVGATTDQ
jgi:hypothetical protein